MSTNKPFFSIITCTYNSGKFLEKNLNSVKKQTFNDYEQIIIDGKSSDKTIQIVKSFQKNNSKIKIFSYPPKGISDAFNKGIQKSNGKYIFFLNSDDSFYDKNVLKNINEFLLQNPEYDWIYGMINVVEENGEKVGVFPNRKIFQTANKYLLKFFNFIPHQAVFMKGRVFKDFGTFDINLKTNMDTELWLRVAPKTNFGFIGRIITNYAIRKDGTSSNAKDKDINIKYLIIAQRKHLNYIELIFARIMDRFIATFNRSYR